MVQPDGAFGRHFPQYAARFIGRESEIAEIAGLLQDPACRLLTLVGLGGIGKTRLAVEVAARLVDDFTNGVYFVPLQPLQVPDQIVMAVVAALGLQQSDQNARESLLAYVTGKHLLLVMDNFEHLRDGAGLLTDILDAAPDIKILVTSRESLRLQREWLRQVRGLNYPDDAATPSDGNDSAVQLFLERARRLQDALNTGNQHTHIVRICRLVEGMPLALELAAGWVKALSCREIAAEIERNLQILAARAQDAPERHRNMQAVFDHSWRLLTAEEQTVLQRMAVFRGGCTRMAAEQITGATLETLASLVEKSLLRHDPETGRYDIHELLRQYAEEQLVKADDLDTTSTSHSQYYLTLVGQREPLLKGHGQLQARDEIIDDLDNISAAWRWAVDQRDYALLDQALGGLFWFTSLTMRLQDRSNLFRYALENLGSEPGTEATSFWWHLQPRTYRNVHLDDWFSKAVTRAQNQDNQGELAFCLMICGAEAWQNAEYANALPYLQESLALAYDVGDRFLAAYVSDWLARVYLCLGDTQKPDQYLQQSLDIWRDIGDKLNASKQLTARVVIALNSGKYDQAEQYLRDSIQSAKEIKDWYAIVTNSEVLGYLTIFRGEFDQAVADIQTVMQLVRPYHIAETEDLMPILGLSASFREDYVTGQQLCRWSFDRAIAACGLGDFTLARQMIWERFAQIPTPDKNILTIALMTINFLPIAAIVLTEDQQFNAATEILGLVFAHPKALTGWMERWPFLNRLRHRLETQLGSEAYAAAWERGRQLDLEQVAHDLLREFGDEPDDLTAQANQSLPEPLTPRELEVLALLAEGLTNPQIAERLFVTTGAIKRYTSNIYGKLGVQNRVQAVSRAQEIGLR